VERGNIAVFPAAMPPWQASRAAWLQAHNGQRSIKKEFQPQMCFSACYVHPRGFWPWRSGEFRVNERVRTNGLGN
jgi:hypothetical protein